MSLLNEDVRTGKTSVNDTLDSMNLIPELRRPCNAHHDDVGEVAPLRLALPHEEGQGALLLRRDRVREDEPPHRGGLGP